MSKKLKQYNVGISDDMMEQLTKSGKIENISLAGYVRVLISNDLKQVPVMSDHYRDYLAQMERP